jgi:hypothetical protein
VSYYAAGGYYQAGGFSFKKLGNWISKTASNPIISGLIGLVPGGSVAQGGLALIHGSSNAASIPNAVQSGTAGTPGHNSAVAQSGRRTRRARRTRRSRW